MKETNYAQFLQAKQKKHIASGFDIDESQLNTHLFLFQKFIVQRALKAGKYAIFADCGLGKTIMQLEWAHQVNRHTKKPVLILAPLAVSGQTIAEGDKFNIEITTVGGGSTTEITNYEQLKNIDVSMYSGVVLDESSILKNFTGVYKNLIIDTFKQTPYKLACTATPSPNDINEIGNHSEFLDVLDSTDMRSRWFVRDEGMNNYRLKGHAKKSFYAWVSSWACMLSKPSDIGDFSDEGYELPKLNFIEKQIKSTKKDNGKLFNDVSVNATNFNRELRITLIPRIEVVAEIVNNSTEQFIIWVNQNAEEDKVRELVPDAVCVRGSDKPELKASRLLGFAKNEFRVLVTKKKIAQFGLNYQNCHNQVHAALDFSFESLYQSIRRSYRFLQKHDVNIYLLTTDTMQNVITSIKEKERQFLELQTEMNKNINSKTYGLTMGYERKEFNQNNVQWIRGDSAIEMQSMPDNSMHFSIFSPPFSNLFTYSNNIADLGNCADDDEFFEQYRYILKELYRVMMPGRLVAVHTKDLARYKGSSGYSGLYDFTGRCHRLMEDIGFRYHSKVTIWTDPVLEMQRTKTQRLLYKQLRKDASYTGVGMAEYLTIFRKWEGNEEDWTPVTNKTRENFPLDTWQKWASPVWMDIRRTDVLNDWRGAKEAKDEKHICPLQISVIERSIYMWTNPGEIVFTPFGGIGSEVYTAVKCGRKGVGIELKEKYWRDGCNNLKNLKLSQNQIALQI